MKKLFLFMMVLLAACSAPMPGEDVGAQQEALFCSGPPIATGTIGGTSDNPYLKKLSEWTGPPAEAFSAKATLSSLFTGKLSWGSASATVFRTTGCIGFDGPCVAWPAGKTTTLRLFNGQNNGGPLFVSFYVNGVKVAELEGANANTSLQNTQNYSGGVTRIRQDTGANSRFYFEGLNAGVWTSWSAKFFNTCGSIN